MGRGERQRYPYRKEMTTEPELKVAEEDPSQPEIIALLRDGEEYSANLYPAESNHHMPPNTLRASNVCFLVARDANGRAVGTGALALRRDWAELKAMWVIPEARGAGVSRMILAALEARARSEGDTYPEAGNRREKSCGSRPLCANRLQAARSVRRLPRRPAERLHAERALKQRRMGGSASDAHQLPAATLVGFAKGPRCSDSSSIMTQCELGCTGAEGRWTYR